MAAIQPKIRLHIIQVEQFIDLAQHYRVLSVPTAIMSRDFRFSGVVPAPRFASMLVHASLSLANDLNDPVNFGPQ